MCALQSVTTTIRYACREVLRLPTVMDESFLTKSLIEGDLFERRYISCYQELRESWYDTPSREHR